VSGFLRTLSVQALGRSVPVKSAARLPYAAVPATLEQAGDEASSPPAAAPIASVAGPPNMADRTAPSEPGIPHGMPSLLFPRREYDAGDESRPARSMRAPADPDSAAPSMTRLAAFEPAEVVESARVSTPPPLVPPATRFVLPPTFAPAPSAGSARTASAHRHSAGSDATEVHVSIGRIEVTAVHEASPPPRRAVPVKPSLPLNEYLARRQRRPS